MRPFSIRKDRRGDRGLAVARPLPFEWVLPTEHLMPVTSSLTNRIFVACTLLAMLSLGFAFYFVNARATREAEAGLRGGLKEGGKLVDRTRLGLTDPFPRLARLVADLPKLK